MNLSAIIGAAKQILIIGHQRADGDCLGAGLSLLKVCQNLGKPADFVCEGDLPQNYSFMSGFERLCQQNFDCYDTVIAVDCGDEKRMGKYQKLFFKAKTRVNIDHHFTNPSFGGINVLDFTACSTCQILGEIYLAEGLMDKHIAQLLYVGLSTDSGHFSHNNTTSRVFTFAAKLLEFGIDAHAIVQNLYRSMSINKLNLIARALSGIRFFDNQRACLLAISSQDLRETGCVLADTEGIITYGINLCGVEAAACITESAENSYKVSFRSKNVDISKAAAVFGGGGHINAAGCMAFGTFDEVSAQVSDAMLFALGQA